MQCLRILKENFRLSSTILLVMLLVMLLVILLVILVILLVILVMLQVILLVYSRYLVVFLQCLAFSKEVMLHQTEGKGHFFVFSLFTPSVSVLPAVNIEQVG